MIQTKVGIINYRISNLNSVIRAFQKIETEVVIINSAKESALCSHLVLPGVGSFQEGMENLINLNLISLILEWVKDGKPLLGICLGMQLLAKTGYEFTKTRGLCLIEGNVNKIVSEDKNFRLPHVGWNSIIYDKAEVLLKDIKNGTSFYFVHSYAYSNESLDYVKGISNYYNNIVSVIEKDNIFGVQFHPEKSQQAGLTLLKNFLDFKC
tara:strand:- start:542 stop:1168 length:627 start_codon:yes stop_codon:yes gene_type:complete